MLCCPVSKVPAVRASNPSLYPSADQVLSVFRSPSFANERGHLSRLPFSGKPWRADNGGSLPQAGILVLPLKNEWLRQNRLLKGRFRRRPPGLLLAKDLSLRLFQRAP